MNSSQPLMRIRLLQCNADRSALRQVRLPDSGEVWICSLRLPLSRELSAHWLATLITDEWTEAARFRAERARQQFLHGRAFLRQLLGRCLDERPEKVVLTRLPGGKPVLAGKQAGSKLCFNLAHAGKLVVVALTSGHRVGVDIEPLATAEDLSAAAHRILSPTEFARWQALPAEHRPQALLATWTRKEAVLKAQGSGLRLDPRHVEVSLNEGGSPRLVRLPTRAGKDEGWHLRSLRFPSGHVGAVAVENQPTREWPTAGQGRRAAPGLLDTRLVVKNKD